MVYGMDGEMCFGIIDLCFRFMPFGVMISENRIVSPCTIGYNNSNLNDEMAKEKTVKKAVIKWLEKKYGRIPEQ